MNSKQMERAAYIAAHRILTTDLNAPELACPGARRSAIVDNIAAIIKGVYEAHNHLDEPSEWFSTNPAALELTPRVKMRRSHGPVPLRVKARATAAPVAGTLH